MMQPPRQMVARSPGETSQSCSSLPAHDLVEALGVGDHLGGVQRGAHVLDELVGVVDGGRVAGLVEDLAGGLALLGVARDAAGEGGLGDAGDRYAEVQRALHGPATGALLLGGVGDHVDERLAGRVVVLEHRGGHLDQERVEVALVPLAEDARRARPAPWRARCAGRRRPRRSAACRRTRCRCAPSSRSGRRRPARRGWRTGCRRPGRRCPRRSGRAARRRGRSRRP